MDVAAGRDDLAVRADGEDFARLRLRFLMRCAVLLLPRRDVVLDDRAVLAGRSGTSFTCLPAVAGRVPTVGFCARLVPVNFLAASLASAGDAAGAHDFAVRLDGDDTAAGANDFASHVDDDDAAAARADDDAAIVVASPKSIAKASLVVSGAAGFTRCSAGFLRLRLRARFWDGGADLVAATFCFLGMGV